MRNSYLLFALTFALLALTSCKPPGKPNIADEWQTPDSITDFSTLYQLNCAACHSITAIPAASQAMNNPLYLKFAGREVIQAAIEKGVHGTTMPGFSQNVGGNLTPAQITILVDGIMKFSEQTAVIIPEDLPSYALGVGDVARGASAFATYCASCHGSDGNGGEHGSSVVNPDFLSLVSDTSLKTSIVVGRPEFGMPNYRDLVPGRVMSNQEIDDVVAWLGSHRPASAPTAAIPAAIPDAPTPPAAAEPAASTVTSTPETIQP